MDISQRQNLEKPEGAISKHFWLIILALWLGEAALLLSLGWDSLLEWKVGDPDDQLRMVQVRDWLAGQSWADVHQYRMNPPFGGDMHWSRLVDIPLALAITCLKPFFGQAGAEFWAAVLIPLLTLGIFLACSARLVRQHFGSAAAIVSTAGLLTAVPIIVQLVPLRVDHHGWQLVCMVLCLTFLLDADRPVRSAALLGVVSAIWMEISIEAFPFVVAFIGILALRWITTPREFATNVLLTPFVVMVVATALSSVLLLSTQKPWTSLDAAPCDALSSAHVVALLASAITAMAAVICLRVMRIQLGVVGKALVCLLSAVSALTVLLVGAPQCVGDSFGNLAPVVQRYWFDRTSEGLPIFRLDVAQQVTAAFIFVTGILALAHLFRSDTRSSYDTKIALLLTFLATAVVGAYVSRTQVYFMIVVSIIAAPFIVFLFSRSDEMRGAVPRLLTKILAIALLVPVVSGQFIANTYDGLRPATPTKLSRFALNVEAAKRCQFSSSIEQLRRLPPSQLLVGLDAAPGILQHSDHKVIASGHHRNQAAMRDVITAFTGPPETLMSVLKRRDVRYIVVCAAAPEFVFYKGMNPEGVWARLDRGETFGSLVEQSKLGPFRIWQVAQ